MNCNDIRPLISAYYDSDWVEGEATPEEYSRVGRHLAKCADCRQALAEYRAIGSGMRAIPVPVPPAGLRRDVWRAIDTQQPGLRGAGVRGMEHGVRNKKLTPHPSPLTPNVGRGWGRTIPAAGLIAAALIIFVGAILVTRNNPSAQAATLLDSAPTYDQSVRVQFNKQGLSDDPVGHTTVGRLEANTFVTLTNAVTSYSPADRILTIDPPNGGWVAGATYKIVVDAQHIYLDAGSHNALDAKPITFTFALAALTATPTNTPLKTATSMPTRKVEPTAVAQVNTSEPISTVPTRVIVDVTDTPRPSATSASTNTVVPTTPTATSTVQPSATPRHNTPTPTTTPTYEPTVTPGSQGTPIPLPNTTATPKPVCSTTPVNGFGKLWNENPVVRTKLGCQQESEVAIPAAVEERFLGGYMFWREDTHTILVFLSDGTWLVYNDAWQESDPTPAPSTPPSGYYEPVRGFGKIWHSQAGLRQRLGWAIDQETAITGAWQSFAHGSALWTSNRYIRVLYDDGTWSGFTDTYTTPTPLPNRPMGE